ncbi:MAG: hypothetical protein HPY55_12260 [Firmicutes bacterium]|nr:hypothetical protein [Bacillota bacterium]
MTHFLSCGFLKDYLSEIHEAASRLDRLLESSGKAEGDDARLAAGFIVLKSGEALEILEAMRCEPLVWTGPGTTDEVIRRLEELLSALDSRQGEY